MQVCAGWSCRNSWGQCHWPCKTCHISLVIDRSSGLTSLWPQNRVTQLNIQTADVSPWSWEACSSAGSTRSSPPLPKSKEYLGVTFHLHQSLTCMSFLQAHGRSPGSVFKMGVCFYKICKYFYSSQLTSVSFYCFHSFTFSCLWWY